MKHISLVFIMMILITIINAEDFTNQGFEGTEYWNYTANPAEMSRLVWWGKIDQPVGEATAQSGDWYWASWDLDGIESSLTFDTVYFSSGYVYSISFWYYSNGLNPDADFSRYSVEFDNGTEWNHWTTLSPDTDVWTQVTITVPVYAQYARLKVAAQYDGLSKYAHWDSFSITRSTAGLLAPVVYNVSAAQRTDGSKLVDVYYDLYDANEDLSTVSLLLSDNSGASFDLVPDPFYLAGDFGDGIANGTGKHIIWDAGSENIEYDGSQYRIRVKADDNSIPNNFVFVEGGYKYHIFTESGTLTVLNDVTAEYLVVAGGGGGGYSYGGAGGAGGLVTNEGLTATYPLNLTAGDYTITVGAGGVGSTSADARGGTGENSTITGADITTITAFGGGGGGSPTFAVRNGGDGGSGGGGYSQTPSLAGNGTQENNPADLGFGNDGWGGTFQYGCGGGAGAAGSNTVGGIGKYVFRHTYAGGGGAYDKLGGLVGGGKGATSVQAAEAGLDGTGSGGGGGRSGSYINGADGGSGIVVIRYATSEPDTQPESFEILKTSNEAIAIIPNADKYIVYKFRKYNYTNRYNPMEKGYSEKSDGSIDNDYMNFAGGDVVPAATISDFYLWGNHAPLIRSLVGATGLYDTLTSIDIGKELTRVSDGKKFCYLGKSSGWVYLLGEPVDVSYDNMTFAQAALNDVLVFGGNNYTLTTVQINNPLTECLINSTTFMGVDVDGNISPLIANGYYNCSKLIITNYAKVIHPKDMYAYLVANVGNITRDGDIVTQDTFFNPAYATPAMKRVQDMNTITTVYADGTMTADDVIISNTASGGVDINNISTVASCCDLTHPLCKHYTPKVLVSPTGTANAVLPASAKNYTTGWHVPSITTEWQAEFNAAGKNSMPDRHIYLDDTNTYGIVNGIFLDIPDNVIADRATNTTGYMLSAATANIKSLIWSKVPDGQTRFRLASYKKYLVNPDNTVNTDYYTIKRGIYTYLYIDLHISTPVGFKITVPSELQSCDKVTLIEKTNSLVLTDYVDDWNLASGLPASFVNNGTTSLYAFAVFKIWDSSLATNIPFEPTLTVTTSITSSGFTLNWSAAGSGGTPTGYCIKVYKLSDMSLAFNATTGNVTTHVVTGLSANTEYVCHIQAYNASGISMPDSKLQLTSS